MTIADRYPGKGDTPSAVVAIPARNEEAYLGACLEALAAQDDACGRPLPVGTYGVLVFLNNCRDRSSQLAREAARSYPVPLRIVERDLPQPQAHAGGARRAAMDFAALWLEERADCRGLLLTTDADSRVGPCWIAANLGAVSAGADAVAGKISLSPADREQLPEHLHHRGRMEAAYGLRLIEIAAFLDPQAHNPWPHHATASGASLALTLAAYRHIGGLPPLPLGEDKALVAALQAQDAKVRFAPDVEVTTSGRLEGRAPGGTADTIRLRCEDTEAVCDESLEPVRTAVLRALWRGRLRRLHAEGRLSDVDIWMPLLDATQMQAIQVSDRGRFGEVWRRIENASPLFRRRRLRPSGLPSQMRCADAVLGRLRRWSGMSEEINSEVLRPLAANNVREVGDLFDQQSSGFVSR